VISAHRLANPQWTLLEEAAPEWMKLGFKVFSVLDEIIIDHWLFQERKLQ
jgi:hypothetical protein